MTTEAFLDAIFGDAPSPLQRLAVFTLPSRRTQFCASTAEAAAHARARASDDVYFGLGLVAGTPRGRGSADDIAAIGCLWADIDLASDAHASKALPTGEADVQAILAQCGVAPSMLVHSGNGYHAYWLLKEPWVFASSEERAHGARLARAWHQRVVDAAASLGFKLENLGDLARVLRVPGSFNRKNRDAPVECRIVRHRVELRYDREDFECAAPEPTLEPIAPAIDAPSVQLDVTLGADRSPPAELLVPLVAESPLFRKTWDRARTDLHDTSSSAYDLSLATIAAMRGWSDQALADLLVAHRRRHHAPLDKALRPSYVARTLAKARGAAGDATAATDADLEAFTRALVGSGDRMQPRSVRSLMADHPDLRDPVIHGLLRQGETMNVIAPPKAGKSWLVTDLAIAVATGRPWLDLYDTVQGDVLIVDNELHGETSANRIPKVAAGRGVPLCDFADRLDVLNLRGGLIDVVALGPFFRALERGRYRVVILDAFYRFMPADMDENDNGTMASVYNRLDSYADAAGCSFVLTHHSSKGNQASKSVTDVGAGAGSQSRATDTHLVLRQHEEERAIVLDAAVRSWPPLEPTCLRWEFPVWVPAAELDPSRLKTDRPKKKRDDEPREAPWTAERFARQFLTDEVVTRSTILARALDAGLSDRKASTLLKGAEAAGLLFRIKAGASEQRRYSRRPPEDA